VRSSSTLSLFFGVAVLFIFSVMVVWPSDPERYLPGDFWPHGNGFSALGIERATMRLGLDLRGGSYLLYEADPPPDYKGDVSTALDGAKKVIERRVNGTGVSEAEVQKTSGNRISIQVPGLSVADVQNKIGKTASLEFKVFSDEGKPVPAIGPLKDKANCPRPALAEDPIPDGCAQMTGRYLQNNTIPTTQGTVHAINFQTTGDGSKLMEAITRDTLRFAIGDPRRDLMIFLDNQLISRATVQSVISDQGQITGQASFSESKDLSDLLNTGALPIPLKTIQSSEVSATLGEDSVVASVHAGEVGLLAVAMFMILYYRLPGALAAMALGVYTASTLMVFKIWPVTLTLSGIAAFVLSVGMAVDANILIFERMKEELRRGRTLNSAIDIGFRRAWTSIRDSNISTLITCLILYWFGDQFGAALVKGFALTLAIGVAVSMFSAITVTRTFLKMVVGTPLARNHWLFNAEETHLRTAGTRAGESRREPGDA
jgi:preprotein translocase subunit SecD